jgi:hypothetical protein
MDSCEASSKSFAFTIQFYISNHANTDKTLKHSNHVLLFIPEYHFLLVNLCSRSLANFMQVIHMATFWIEEWSLLLSEDQRELIVSGCNRLLIVTRDFYRRAGWRLLGD